MVSTPPPLNCRQGQQVRRHRLMSKSKTAPIEWLLRESITRYVVRKATTRTKVMRRPEDVAELCC